MLGLMEGDRIGPYRILHTLGVGGMGEVYLAERVDAEFEQKVAIKVVHAGSLRRGTQSRFKIERQILAQLDHPNIAHLLDGGTMPDGTAYIVMEYVGGDSLREVRNRHREEHGVPLPVAQAIAYILEILPAFGYLHRRGLLICDFKPDNVIQTEEQLRLTIACKVFVQLLAQMADLYANDIVFVRIEIRTPA